MSPHAQLLPASEERLLSILESLDPPHPRCGAGRVRVVVLGAGYGGITAALRLARRLKEYGCTSSGAELVLVDRHPYHLLKTRLYEAAVSREKVAVSISDLIRKLPIRFVQGEVNEIDLGRRRVVTSAGEIDYDVLVIAVGAQPAFRGIPGLPEYVWTLRTRLDALALRRHLERLRARSRWEELPATRARLRRIVIAGGGFSGVELAAELSDHPGRRDGEIVLLEAGERLLPGAGPLLSRWATKQLRRRGVRVETRTELVRAEAGVAHLSTGEAIPAATLVWMGGVRVGESLQSMGAPTGRLGRVLVDETLQVLGSPGVYAIGDAALATDPLNGVEVPLTARFAAQEGRYVAEAIAARLRRRWVAPYRPRVRSDAYNMERYLGLTSLAFGGSGRGRLGRALARRLKRFPATRHMICLRGERVAWHLGAPLGRRVGDAAESSRSGA